MPVRGELVAIATNSSAGGVVVLVLLTGRASGDASRRPAGGLAAPCLAIASADLWEVLPSIRLPVLPGAEHAVNVEQPEEFSAAVRAFPRRSAAAQLLAATLSGGGSEVVRAGCPKRTHQPDSQADPLMRQLSHWVGLRAKAFHGRTGPN
jgi:hypothetical protein